MTNAWVCKYFFGICAWCTFPWRAPSPAGTARLSLFPTALGAAQLVGHIAVLLSHPLAATQPRATPSAS